jgi:hypothetical protein
VSRQKNEMEIVRVRVAVGIFVCDRCGERRQGRLIQASLYRWGGELTDKEKACFDLFGDNVQQPEGWTYEGDGIELCARCSEKWRGAFAAFMVAEKFGAP